MSEFLKIEVVPDSKKEGVIKGPTLVVKVKEPPLGGRANKAAAKLLSKYFKKRIRIISGGRRRKKTIEVF